MFCRRITYQKKLAVKRYFSKHSAKQTAEMFGISISSVYLIVAKPLLTPVPLKRLEQIVKRDGRTKYYEQ